MENDTDSEVELPPEAALAIVLVVTGGASAYRLAGTTVLTFIQAAAVMVLVGLIGVSYVFSLPYQFRAVRAKWYAWKINQHHRNQSPFTKTVGRAVALQLVQFLKRRQTELQAVITRKKPADDTTEQPHDQQPTDDATSSNLEEE